MNKSRENCGKIGDENIRIVEEKIHPDVFSEFYLYLDDSFKKYDEIPHYKREFVELARAGSIESYRKIESAIISGNLPEEVKDFAIVALNHCRFKLENELLDVPADMISGGLGGSNNRIRFYLVLVGKNGMNRDQFEYIKRVFDKVTKERDSILEEIRMHDFYVSLIILGSFNYAYGEIIESGICLCDFLQTD